MFEKAQVVAFVVLFVVLFAAVLTAPRYMLGVRCVAVVSGLLALVAAQWAWLRGSAWLVRKRLRFLSPGRHASGRAERLADQLGGKRPGVAATALVYSFAVMRPV